MNALPLLLLGGAAVLVMAGGKKGRSGIVEKGVFPAGEPWRIVRTKAGGVERYIIEADLEMSGKWVTFSKMGMAMAFPSLDVARQAIQKVADGDLLVDERGEVSA